MESINCENTECILMDMVGKMIQFHGDLYLFCPGCGLPAKYTHSGHGEIWKCTMCLQEQKGEISGGTMECDLCGMMRDKWEAVEVVGDKQFLAVCSLCERPWMKDVNRDGVCRYTKEQMKQKIGAEGSKKT